MIKLKVADLFTLGNLAAGFSAILTLDVRLAAGLIVLGAGFDVLDGLVARAMKQQSELGKQLDSLADMVTFGVAPAVLFFHLLPPGLLTTIVCTLIPVFSACRLAQFNLLPSQPFFIGLPTPANALWYVGLALWVPQPPEAFASIPLIGILLSLSLFLSVLMVSPVRFPAVKALRQKRQDGYIMLAGLTGLTVPLLAGHPAMAINGFLSLMILASIIVRLFGKKF
ncbi:MAG: CDP-alcohol phosphatidyltransferase family protein [Saprospiraceae bacterium]|nr:CDP-alcohol phosphatidyltransferase family protein [Saprospiraceae bacterium]